ncbi:MAG: sulfur carrier protein ThiS [Deltaproteobacteria bacterium]|nr:sulfur carrier protein ThiS [Deltaproteobacteria bacterium]
MTIKLNGKEKTYDTSGVSVSELLSLEKVITPGMVTVQLNGKFLLQKTFADTKVKEGDRVEFLHFMEGGSGGCAPGGERGGAE